MDRIGNLRRGFEDGRAEFIRAAREVQEDLGFEPMREKEIEFVLRIVASVTFLIVYSAAIYYLVAR